MSSILCSTSIQTINNHTNKLSGEKLMSNNDIDLKKFDKNGNLLNIIPKADHKIQGNYYQRWLDSGKTRYEPSAEDIKCELQLQALSSWEPLQWKFKLNKIEEQLKPYNDKWVPYLRRDGVMNDREGLLLTGLEGDKYNDSLSMPEVKKRVGRSLTETEFMYPTQLYHDLKELQPMLDFFAPLGRTMLVKVNKGGWFPPHKDHPMLTRDCFRIVAFLSYQTDHEAYEWEHEGQIRPITPGRAYYVDTRKTHRTAAWLDNSIHLVVNIPKTWENVIKIMSTTLNF